MSRFTKQIASYWKQLGSVVRNEFRTIFKDGGVMLILIFALIIYATAYSLAYGSQVLRNVPIGVVDECRTPTSRSLIDTFNAGPNTYVAYNPTSMEEAKELFYGRKIYGVVYIPSDYGKKLYGGEQANVAIYADASYFLMYRQVFQEVVTSIGKTGAMVEFQRLIAKGANIPQAQATTQPVIYQSHNLFNPYLGYGTFVMPAIIMVIIQQTMLIGIGMIGGTWREFGLYRKLCPAGRRRMSTLPIVLGRGLVYALIYAVTCTYILGLHYRLFHFPMNGATGAVMLFIEHDGAERGDGQKQRRARAYDDARFATCGKATECPFPLLLTLIAMIEEDGGSRETLFGVPSEFEGNGHFRRENEGGASADEAGVGKFQIDGRLAAARDAEQKMSKRPFFSPGEKIHFPAVVIERGLLFFGELKRRFRRRKQLLSGFGVLFFPSSGPQFHELVSDESGQSRRGVRQGVVQLSAR